MQRLGKAIAWVLCIWIIGGGCLALTTMFKTEVPRLVKYSFNAELLMYQVIEALPSLIMIGFASFIIKRCLLRNASGK